MSSSSLLDPCVKNYPDKCIKIQYLAVPVFIGLAIAAIGILKNPAILTTTWSSDESIVNLTSYTVIYAATILVAVFIAPKRAALFSIIPLFLLGIISIGLCSILIPILSFIAVGVCGSAVLPKISGKEPHGSSIFLGKEIEIVLGFCILAAILFFLSIFKIDLNKIAPLMLLLPFCFFKNCKIFFSEIFKELERIRNLRKFELATFFGIIYLISIHLYKALNPEFDFDALAAHLMIPHFVKIHGYWSFDFTQFVFGANQLTADLLYSFVYVMTDEFGARFFNFLFTVLVLCLTYKISRIWSSQIISLLMTLVLASSPLLFTQTSSLHIESVWISFLLASSAVALQILSKNEKAVIQNSLYYLVAIIGGVALSVKLPSVFYLPFIALVPLFRIYKQKVSIKFFLKTFIVALLLFSFFGLLPYLYSYILTGNPVFPYFNGVFKSSDFYQSTSFNNSLFNKPLSIRTLYDMTFHGSFFLESRDYALPLIYLVFVLPVIVYYFFQFKNLLYSLVIFQVFISFIGVYLFQSYFRYLLPSLVLFPICLAKLLSFFEFSNRNLYRLSLIFIFLSIPIAIIHIPDPSHNYKDFDWKKVINKKYSEDFLYKRPQKFIFDYLNTRYGKSASVLILHGPLTAGLDGTSLVNAWYNPELHRRLSSVSSIQEMIEFVKVYGISHISKGPEKLPNQIITDFLNNYTEIELHHGSIILHKTNFLKLPSVNLLQGKSPELGYGAEIELQDSRKYLYQINIRKNSNELLNWYSTVAWLDSTGSQIGREYFLNEAFNSNFLYEFPLVAPKDAKKALVVIGGSNFSSLVVDNITFIKLGEHLSLPRFAEKIN